MAKRQVTGWLLDAEDRARLLERFPPKFPDVIAEHVTLHVGGRAALPRERNGEVVGEIDDGAGLQALVVRIAGTTDRRTHAAMAEAARARAEALFSMNLAVERYEIYFRHVLAGGGTTAAPGGPTGGLTALPGGLGATTGPPNRGTR